MVIYLKSTPKIDISKTYCFKYYLYTEGKCNGKDILFNTIYHNNYNMFLNVYDDEHLRNAFFKSLYQIPNNFVIDTMVRQILAWPMCDRVIHLLHKLPWFSIVDENKTDLIIYCMEFNYLNTTKILINIFASFDLLNTTHLHIALERGYHEIFSMLLSWNIHCIQTFSYILNKIYIMEEQNKICEKMFDFLCLMIQTNREEYFRELNIMGEINPNSEIYIKLYDRNLIKIKL